MIHVAPDAPRLNADSSGRRVHTNALHSGKVDYQTVITGSEAGSIVTATSNRGHQAIFPAKVHCRHDVGDIHATRNEPWAFVDHAVVDFACRLIGSIMRLDKFPTEGTLQLIYRLCRHRILPITVTFDPSSNEPKTTLGTSPYLDGRHAFSSQFCPDARARKVYQFWCRSE
jgi:hypothetical protein